jgi:hypothetical protein
MLLCSENSVFSVACAVAEVYVVNRKDYRDCHNSTATCLPVSSCETRGGRNSTRAGLSANLLGSPLLIIIHHCSIFICVRNLWCGIALTRQLITSTHILDVCVWSFVS